MNTISNEVLGGRRRRKHSAEFKAQAVAACRHPGVSIASVAMANGVNANLLRRWVVDAEQSAADRSSSLQTVSSGAPAASATPGFAPLQLAPDAVPANIRIKLRRAGTVVTVAWPARLAADCARLVSRTSRVPGAAP